MPEQSLRECPPLFTPPEWEAFERLVGDSFQRHIRKMGQPIVHVLSATPDDHRTGFGYLLVCVPGDWSSIQRMLALRDGAVSVFGDPASLPRERHGR